MAGPASREVSDSITPGSCSEGPWAWLNALLLPSWHSSYFLNTRLHSPTLLSCTGSPSCVASPDRESTFGLHRWICPPNRCYRTLLWADVILSPASVSILTERQRQIDWKAGATEASGSLPCVAPSKALGGPLEILKVYLRKIVWPSAPSLHPPLLSGSTVLRFMGVFLVVMVIGGGPCWPLVGRVKDC